MRVKSCSAFTDNSRPIDLSDEHGCVLRPKMISKFMKIAGADTRFVSNESRAQHDTSLTFLSRASVVTYAFFHAFKFPDSMAVNIRCKVRKYFTKLERKSASSALCTVNGGALSPVFANVPHYTG